MKKTFGKIFQGLALFLLCAIGAYFYLQTGWREQKVGQLSEEVTKLKKEILSAQTECRNGKETLAKARAYLEYLDLLLCPAGTSQVYECNGREQWLAELKKQGYAMQDQEIKNQLDILTPQNSDGIMKELIRICLHQAQYYLR